MADRPRGSWPWAGFIGSFLNVVVYRLPAGMSVVAPRSRCPQCLHPIRWFDNVPVLSWFLLGGRCRDCRAAISPRYPLVEAISGALFLVLAVGEPLAEGENLPAGRRQLDAGQLCGIYAYHLLLLCTLLAAALMQYDGHRPPLRLFAAGPGGRAWRPRPFWPVAASRARLARRHAGRWGTSSAPWPGWRPGRPPGGCPGFCVNQGTSIRAVRVAARKSGQSPAGQRRDAGLAGRRLHRAVSRLAGGLRAGRGNRRGGRVAALAARPPATGGAFRPCLADALPLGWILAWGFAWGLLVRWVALV